MSWIENKELFDLMQSFYTLTGILIALFDEKYNLIVQYPPKGSGFCHFMRQNPEFNKKCLKSDAQAFKACQKSNTLTMYKCHAGLIEATAPIVHDGIISGYIMLGQISDTKDKNEFLEIITNLCSPYADPDKIRHHAKSIKYKNAKQVISAAKILESCTGYIQLKGMVRPSDSELLKQINEYISDHLSEQITVSSLCSHFHISRTSLYDATNQHTNGGLARYIKEKRLDTAKKLLEVTDLPISTISDKVGFSDYNYFSRVFKQRYKVSPKSFRTK